MSDIRIAIAQLPSPQKEIGTMLIEFYKDMKNAEILNQPQKGQIQATTIVMYMNDFEKLIIK